jgi:hypothetical protein
MVGLGLRLGAVVGLLGALGKPAGKLIPAGLLFEAPRGIASE